MTTTIRVNADLFRIAAMCQSTEETRYYLQGVYCAPHAVKGVDLVATDGHRLIHVYDEHGHADTAAIVYLGKDCMKACKPARKENRRELHVDVDASNGRVRGSAQVLAFDSDPDADDPLPPRPVGVQAGVIVDGTFPDWRRVVPHIPTDRPRVADAFDGRYIESFAKIGRELTTAGGDHRGLMTIHSDKQGSPALIFWQGVRHAYGVLMPCRVDDVTTQGVMPAFFAAQPEMRQAA